MASASPLAVRPFAFDRDFTTVRAPRQLDERAFEAMEAELERLRRGQAEAVERARAEGFEAGLAEARGEIESALLAAVDSLQASLEAIDDQLAESGEHRTRDAARIALAAAELIAGRALDAAPEATIDAAIDRVLQQASRNPHVSIRVSSSLVERMEQLIAERTGRERRRMTLTVIGDATLPPGDAYLFWDGGGLQLDAEARRAAVLEELGPLLGD